MDDWDFDVNTEADLDPANYDSLSTESYVPDGEYLSDENPAFLDMGVLQAIAAQQEQVAQELMDQYQFAPQEAQAFAANLLGGPLQAMAAQTQAAPETREAKVEAPSAFSGDRILGKEYALDKNFGGFGLQPTSPSGEKVEWDVSPPKSDSLPAYLAKMLGVENPALQKYLIPGVLSLLSGGANFFGAQSANKDAADAARRQQANVQGALSNFKNQMARSSAIPGRGYMNTTANRRAINIG